MAAIWILYFWIAIAYSIPVTHSVYKHHLVSRNSLNLTKLSYVLRRSSIIQPPYDHFCPFMKAIFNCAKNSTWSGESAYHWGLAMTTNTGIIFLREIINSFGGIKSIYSSLGRQYGLESRPTASVLLVGNSYLRQIWESIACKFRHLSDSGLVLLNGPLLSLSNIEALGSVDSTDFNMINTSLVRGCHGQSFKRGFYREGVAPPPQTASCSDDIAMIEVESVKYYFIFRPYVYKNITGTMESLLGLKIDDIDLAFVNDITEQNERAIYSLLRTREIPVSIIDLSDLLPFLQSLQLRDIGKWFGADNPLIVHPPDDHPCMPGVPEDEVDILMLIMKWRLSGIVV